MFFDIGWPELLLIGVVALVVIGPKDLPRAMRVAGFWLRKARSLSREFQNSIDQMIREAELDEVRDDLRKVADFDIEGEFHRTVDPDGGLAESIRAPERPDYPGGPEALTTTAATGRLALPAPAKVASEAPLPPGMPAPHFVGFEAEASPPAASADAAVEPAKP
ncbi:MAG TPA: Sec-independent protein translocase protein TatB [Stellaceae bacterium]|nr:Sec-independent protein translocase protein TatB [Stellaceae bacterium]